MSGVPPSSPSSAGFETIFRAAVKEYKKKTKKDIASLDHPLARQLLQSCSSPNAILVLLREQVDRSQISNEKLTKWLDPIVNVLYAFSGTIGSAVGLVIAMHAASARDLH